MIDGQMQGKLICLNLYDLELVADMTRFVFFKKIGDQFDMGAKIPTIQTIAVGPFESSLNIFFVDPETGVKENLSILAHILEIRAICGDMFLDNFDN